MGLNIKHCDNLALYGYVDVDYACTRDDRRSIIGYYVYFGDTLVSWSSQKKHVVSRSDAESEYRTLALVSREIAWLE